MLSTIFLTAYVSIRTVPQSIYGQTRGKKRSGASLVRGPYCQLDVGLCDVDVFLHWNSAAEEGAGVGLKLDLQGGTGFNLLRVHFWAPVQRKRV